jgi:hypothetical protein
LLFGGVGGGNGLPGGVGGGNGLPGGVGGGSGLPGGRGGGNGPVLGVINGLGDCPDIGFVKVFLSSILCIIYCIINTNYYFIIFQCQFSMKLQ